MYENYEMIVLSPSSEKEALSAAEGFLFFLFNIFKLSPRRHCRLLSFFFRKENKFN